MEFRELKKLLDEYFPGAAPGTTGDDRGTAEPLLSMGMSGDYKIAIREGSNMIRIGSLLFGQRDYPVNSHKS
jgi:uncharacterized pyridoxal phosphate-containing UPF0001 family protein